jgi:hypothetical protein
MPWWAWLLLAWCALNTTLIEILHLTSPIWRRR